MGGVDLTWLNMLSCRPNSIGLDCKTSGYWIGPVMPTHAFALLRKTLVVPGSSHPGGHALYHLTRLSALLWEQLNRPWVRLYLSQGRSIQKLGLQFTHRIDDSCQWILTLGNWETDAKRAEAGTADEKMPRGGVELPCHEQKEEWVSQNLEGGEGIHLAVAEEAGEKKRTQWMCRRKS